MLKKQKNGRKQNGRKLRKKNNPFLEVSQTCTAVYTDHQKKIRNVLYSSM